MAKTKTQADPQRSPEAIAARQAIMNALLDKLANGMSSLWSRWQDEKEYEDFAEYGKVMTKWVTDNAPAGTVVTGYSKRPFGITFQIPGFPYKCVIQINGRTYGWGSV